MNNSIKNYHRKPTYEELFQEAIINPTEMIKYPNRIATQLRNTPQLTRFDDENFLDVNILNSNAMKQNIQQTAVQKALQPISRQIKTGLEQFDIFDTDESIQQQADDNEAHLEELQTAKRKRDDNILDKFEDALSDPSQIDEMMASSSSNIRGNLRGSSSSSAAAATLQEEEEEEEEDIQPNVRKIIEDIEIKKLLTKANKWIKILALEIKHNSKENIDTDESRDRIK
jgi:predicted phage tail protein